MCSLSDAYYLVDEVSVYRQMPSGITVRHAHKAYADTYLVRFYYFAKNFGLKVADVVPFARNTFIVQTGYIMAKQSFVSRLKYAGRIWSHKETLMFYLNRVGIPALIAYSLGLHTLLWMKVFSRVVRMYICAGHPRRQVLKLYEYGT